MNDTVQSFLTEVKERKTKELMGIEIDMQYYNEVVGDDNEDSLREKLAEENSRRVVDKKGNIINDGRDQEVIANLTKRIDEITRAKQELEHLKGLKEGITKYIGYVNSPSKEVVEQLEIIANIAGEIIEEK